MRSYVCVTLVLLVSAWLVERMVVVLEEHGLGPAGRSRSALAFGRGALPRPRQWTVRQPMAARLGRMHQVSTWAPQYVACGSQRFRIVLSFDDYDRGGSAMKEF